MSTVALVLAVVVGAPGERVAFKRQSTEPSEKAEKIAAMWSRVFAPPSEHDWDLDLSAGWQLWERAHGPRLGNGLFRLTARRQLRELPGGQFLGGAAFVDGSWLRAGTAQLDVDEVQLVLGLGAGFLHWAGRFRFDVTLEGGALVRWVTIADGLSADRHASVVEPAIGGTGGVAVALFGGALFGVRGGARVHSGRVDALLAFEVGWAVDAE